MLTANFHDKLVTLLKTDARFVDDTGELIIATVRNHAWQLEHGLIRLLMSNKEIEQKFFNNINGRWVFNYNTFITYIADKNFLDGSYTQFRNRIGLNYDDKYLSQRGEVSLVWPYKDCVLEGGQTRAEEMRQEIFFNECLAEDEINRLLAPKVLTGWKRHTDVGGKPVSDIKRDADGTIRENLIIKGNNLLALHSLKQQFRGKVKLIYIDPPYNTGNDSFGYNNRFNHSSWLTFMKNRLEIATELLRLDGVIFVQCDDNEQAYLKVLMDEVFGSGNFIANAVVLINRSGRDYGSIAHTHEYLLIYAKNPKTQLNLIEDSHKHFAYQDECGGFNLMELRNRNILFNDKTSPNLCYPFYVNPLRKDGNGLLEVALEPKDGFIEVMPLKSQGVQTVWRWSKAKVRQNLNTEIMGKAKRSRGYMIVQKYRKTVRRQRSIWDEKEFVNQRGTKHLKTLFNQQKVFAYPKSEHMIARILELGSDVGELVLDFHLGSGTTAAVAHKMGRQYLGVEQMDYVETIAVERLKKVIAAEPGGISKSVGWQGGGNFLYCELMPYNQTYMDKIEAADSSEELVRLWHNIAAGAFLNWYVNPEVPEDAVGDFIAIGQTENGLHKQKQLLMELLDKNQLYVNLSEIEDADFGISEEDKWLNKAFYGGADDV